MKLNYILLIIFSGVAFNVNSQPLPAVQAEFVATSNTVPQMRLTSTNGKVNEIATDDNGDFIVFMNGIITGDRLHINDDTGFVGINNPNPQRQLDVVGNATISNFLFSERSRIGGNSDGNTWELGVTGDQINREGKLFLTNKSNPTGPDDMGVTFENNAGGARWSVYLNETGGIPFNDLDFAYNNTVMAFISETDGVYNTVSDVRKKKNISDLNPLLNKLMQLKAQKYQYIHNESSDKYTIGFIAQEVNKLFPEVVSSDRDFMALNYDAFGVLAIQAIQEQQAIINNQQKQIIELKENQEKSTARFAELDSKIESLLRDKK